MNEALEKFVAALGDPPKKKPVTDNTKRLADQAIKAMREISGNNDEVLKEVIQRLSVRPTRFDIHRDNKGDMVSIIPVYEKSYG